MAKITVKQILKEIEDEINEISTTAGAPGYQTPNAFSGKEGDEESDRMKKIAKRSMPDMSDRESNVVDIDNPTNQLKEGRSKYYNYRDSKTYKKPASKISFTISQIKKMMTEVEYLTKITTRLKQENDVSASKYWKRSVIDLVEIGDKLDGLVKNIKPLSK